MNKETLMLIIGIPFRETLNKMQELERGKE